MRHIRQCAQFRIGGVAVISKRGAVDQFTHRQIEFSGLGGNGFLVLRRGLQRNAYYGSDAHERILLRANAYAQWH